MYLFAVLLCLTIVIARIWSRRIFRRSLDRVFVAQHSELSERAHTSISIERDGNLFWPRPFKVFIDGAMAGDVSPEEVQSFVVEPGDHKVRVSLDWIRSYDVPVTVIPGAECRLQCGLSKVFEHLGMKDLFNMIFRSRGMLSLQPVNAPDTFRVDDGRDLVPLTIGFANFSGKSFSALMNADLETLSPIFKNINVAPVNQIPSGEILFLYADLQEDGTLLNTAVKAGIRQIVQLTEAKMVVLATPNSSDSIQKAIALPGPKSANLVFTLERNGESFGFFFRDLFEKMRAGIPMLTAWVQLSPQRPDVASTECPATLMAAEAGNLEFPQKD